MEERLNQHEDRIDRNDVSIGRFQEAMIEWGIRSLRTTRILDDLRADVNNMQANIRELSRDTQQSQRIWIAVAKHLDIDLGDES
jgi:hypothetical protein